MNVLPLVGIVYEHAEVDALPLVVTPFMEKGDLKTLISDCSYVSCMFAAKHVQMYACRFFLLMISNEETPTNFASSLFMKIHDPHFHVVRYAQQTITIVELLGFFQCIYLYLHWHQQSS